MATKPSKNVYVLAKRYAKNATLTKYWRDFGCLWLNCIKPPESLLVGMYYIMISLNNNVLNSYCNNTTNIYIKEKHN